MTTRTILVVDDDEASRKVLQEFLTSDGYNVQTVADGMGALRLAGTTMPDLLLLDLGLPDLDGVEVMHRLRAMTGGAEVPILALSGDLPRLVEMRAAAAGFSEFLKKPIHAHQLRATVRTYLPRRTPPPEAPGRGRLVLIADDDPVQLKLLAIRLRELGLQVETAKNGEEALALARATHPVAIVSDILMPRLDGFGLCLALRRESALANVPIILLSSTYSEKADRRLAQDVGARAMLFRTPENEEVMKVLFEVLDGACPPAAKPGVPDDLPAADDYTPRLIQQLEHQASLAETLSRRNAVQGMELAVLARITDRLAGHASLEVLLGDVLAKLGEACESERGAIFAVAPDGALTILARHGLTGVDDAELCGFFGCADLVRQVRDTRSLLALPSSRIPAERTRPLLARLDAQSIVLSPLVQGNDVFGVAVLASRTVNLHGEGLAFLRTGTAQIGQAIALARSLERATASERRYAELVEGVDAAVWEFDVVADRVTFVNRKLVELLGFSQEDWLTRPEFWISTIHPADRERVRSESGRAIAESERFEVDHRYVAADGRTVWMRDRVHVARDAAAGPIRLFGVSVDVTAARLAAQRRDAEHAVARILSEADGTADTDRNLLEGIGGALGWEVGAIYSIHPKGETLQLDAFWHASDVQVPRFESRTRGERFQSG
ncbi:MAG: response regulator, partial [Planctomycetes bacterium]|nr:response regulator [Planctomycetota bacterium]